MTRRRSCALGMWLACAVGCTHTAPSSAYSSQPTARSLSATNASGVTIRVATKHSDPSLWLNVPDEPAGQDAVLILLPEHVTVRRRGTNEAEHLYFWQPGQSGSRSSWTHVRNALQYEAEFAPGIHFLAQVSPESDGVLYHYEFVNQSDVDFDSVQAVTDPRMISPLFHDVRLERTYVHGPQGFVLLASDIPERLTMPLDQWLPNRYRISYAWPVRKNSCAEGTQTGLRSLMLPNGLMNQSWRRSQPTAIGLWQPSLGTQEIYGRILSLPASMPTQRSLSHTTAKESLRRRCYSSGGRYKM